MNKQNVFLVAFLGIVGFAVVFAFASVISVFQTENSQPQQQQQMGQRLTRMSLSPFDVKLAKQFMDKNGDGMCDVCGMDVQLCIDSGQLQCNMDSKSTIGILGSQHIHADWKIYINGKALGDKFFDSIAMDMSNTNNGISSSFIHVDKGAPPPEMTGDVLHMHATGVPLWIFSESVGLELPENVRVYVNGKEIQGYRDYIFNNLDKILITDGMGNLDEQIASITDFAKNH